MRSKCVTISTSEIIKKQKRSLFDSLEINIMVQISTDTGNISACIRHYVSVQN